MRSTLTPPRLSRRLFLRGAAATSATALAGQTGLVRIPAFGGGAFATPLTFPTVLDAADITLTARAGEASILPGAPTRVWGFDGTFPGPTIRRPSGEQTRVTVRHRLDDAPESLTVHLHGGHTPARFDGQPEREVIHHGSEFTYVYDLVEDGHGERGALQWYHDHSHFRTARNVWNGLAGMFVIDEADLETSLGLPVGDRDLPLLVTDRLFDRDNQFAYPFAPDAERPTAGPGSPPFADAIGNVVLVNGVADPYLDVAPEPYRFRLLNASNFRPYNFAIAGHGPLTQIATESGLLPHAVGRDAVLLGPAERAEIVVDFSAFAGQTLRLASVPDPGRRDLPATGPGQVEILELRVDRAPSPVPPIAAPGPLRPLPDWVDELDETVDRVWAFGLGLDERGRAAWTINGRSFDHSRVDARVELGSTETWALVNTSPTGTSHYVHIHDVDWLVLSRNGEAPPPGEDGLKETFRLDPGEVVVVASKFTDHLGTYMIHCHMLEHEDHGMMTTYEVVPPGSGDRVSPVPGVTPTLLVAGAPRPVDVTTIDGPERDRVLATVAGVAARPGRPAVLDHPLAGRAVTEPVFCDLGLA